MSGQPYAIGGRARIPAARARWHSCRTMTDCFRELDRRSNDRIDVRLLWRQRDDRVIVTVADGKTGKRFTLDVTESEAPSTSSITRSPTPPDPAATRRRR